MTIDHAQAPLKGREAQAATGVAEGIRGGPARVLRRYYPAPLLRLVGIHPKTLKRWERLGVVEGQLVPILNSPTRVFSESDVRFGKSLIALLRSRPGELSVAEAARPLQR